MPAKKARDAEFERTLDRLRDVASRVSHRERLILGVLVLEQALAIMRGRYSARAKPNCAEA